MVEKSFLKKLKIKLAFGFEKITMGNLSKIEGGSRVHPKKFERCCSLEIKNTPIRRFGV